MTTLFPRLLGDDGATIQPQYSLGTLCGPRIVRHHDNGPALDIDLTVSMLVARPREIRGQCLVAGDGIEQGALSAIRLTQEDYGREFIAHQKRGPP